MSRQNHLLHYHISKKKRLGYFDKVAVIAAFLYPLSGLPQALGVFSGNAAGVSLVSWISFIAFSALFLAYGLVHKIKPMVITNFLWLIVDGLVVIGLFMHHMVR